MVSQRTLVATSRARHDIFEIQAICLSARTSYASELIAQRFELGVAVVGCGERAIERETREIKRESEMRAR